PARGSVRTWLMLRMRSRAVDRVRARKRAKVVLDPEGQPPEVATAMPDPSATAERTRVRAAIAELPENERQVLELVYFGGMTHAEVAEAHSIPLGTVKSRVARAIRHLRTSMRSSDESSKGEHDDS
ncbi:MAG: sigma-70 family RNA polymerase sigma factor, partial [Myxococcota bacterium]